ncbi:MAG: AmpG family muropeptide MFS transporter, partial [Alphaproteobacteria bacterium]
MTAAPAVRVARRSWRESLLVYKNTKVLGMLFLGFSAGLPFLMVFSTLSGWLAREDISRGTIGFFSWVGITYSIKFFWAPVVDRVALPFLTRAMGKRRSWMLLAMIGIGLGILGMSATDPTQNLTQMALFALVVAFSSATQDIAIDAYRIEIVAREVQGAMAAAYQLGYRIALLAAGGGAFIMAGRMSWPAAYQGIAGLTLVGIVTVF